MLAFDLADKYRTIAILAGDGMIGQMMEPAELPPMRRRPPCDDRRVRVPQRARAEWALSGAKGRRKNTIATHGVEAEALEAMNCADSDGRIQRSAPSNDERSVGSL